MTALLASSMTTAPVARTLIACAVPIGAAIGGSAWAARRLFVLGLFGRVVADGSLAGLLRGGGIG